MISDVHKALQTFWSQFEWDGNLIPAYASGEVPNGAQLPYITYQVAYCNFGEATILSMMFWCNLTKHGNICRAEMLDAIASAIGHKRTIPIPGGSIRLYPATPYQSYYDDPTERDVIGGRTSLQAHFYSA